MKHQERPPLHAPQAPPIVKIKFLKEHNIVRFDVYVSRVGTFIANELHAQAGKIVTNSICAKDYKSIHSFLIVSLLSNVVETLYDNYAYTKKGFKMWVQV